MKALPPYILRMQEEQAELINRLGKGCEFAQSAAFQTLDSKEKSLLTQQLDHMEEYSTVLAQRINYAISLLKPKDQYPDGHPDWTKDDWVTEVTLDHTLLGYWDWVEHNLTVAASEAVDGN